MRSGRNRLPTLLGSPSCASTVQARARFDARELGSTALADIELACVRQLVALQESIGLDVVTDGEIGRLNFQDSFGLAVSGFDAAPETLQVHQRRAAGGGPLRRWDIPDLAQTGTAVLASAANGGAAYA